jgi:NADH:ubiquinone oxidoreductase subunit E
MEDMGRVDVIIEKYANEPGSLTAVLQDIQAEYNYLPQESLKRISEKMVLPLSQVLHVATFYKAFSLEPRGKHLITVCLGTACHVRGGPRIVNQIERSLNIRAGGTTADGLFTLETVNCVGACALGPMMIVDGQYHGQMAASRVDRVLKKYMESGEGTGNA